MSHGIRVMGILSAGLDNIWINIMNYEIKAIHIHFLNRYIALHVYTKHASG